MISASNTGAGCAYISLADTGILLESGVLGTLHHAERAEQRGSYCCSDGFKASAETAIGVRGFASCDFA